MFKHGKKYRKAREQVSAWTSIFQSKEALAKVKGLAFAKFDESVDVHVNLGIDAIKGRSSSAWFCGASSCKRRSS